MMPHTDSDETDLFLHHTHLPPAVAKVMRVIAMALIAVSLFLGGLALHRAQLPYNEKGNFFDVWEGVVYRTQAVEAYGALALCFTLIGGCVYLFALPHSGSGGARVPINRPGGSPGFRRRHRVPRG